MHFDKPPPLGKIAMETFLGPGENEGWAMKDKYL
jgi:hypothetical protein